MYKLSVKNNKGEVLDLTDNKNYTVFKVEGLTPPTANISQSDNANADGGVINNVRLSARNLVIYMTIDNEVEASRINLYRYFPPKKTVTIYFSNGSRNVYIEGVVEVIECDLFTTKQVAQISLICPKPYFIDVNEFSTQFSDINAAFEFPFSIAAEGIEFSNIVNNIRKNIYNAGDIESGLTIELFAIGSVVNPVIYDVFKRTHLRLNMTLLQSDLVTINTGMGDKRITLRRNATDTNIIGNMTPDSDWLQLDIGDNVFTYDCDSGNANLQITFKTKALYGGV